MRKEKKMKEDNRLYSIIGVCIWVGVILVAVVLFFLVGAFAQIPIDQVLQGYEDRDLEGCEVWEIYYAMYTPLRIELEYDFATDREPKISSNDPESDVDVFSTPTRMNIITNSTDFHIIELFIQYENQTNTERRVDYRFYTNDGILTQEGNWHDTGTYFCKTLMFWAEPAPNFPTPEEVRAEERAFFDEQLIDIKTNQDESEGFFGIALIIVLAVGMLVALLVITSYMNQKRVTKPINDARGMMVIEAKKMQNTRINMKNTIDLWDLEKSKTMNELREMIDGFVKLIHSTGKQTQLEELPPPPEPSHEVTFTDEEIIYDVPSEPIEEELAGKENKTSVLDMTKGLGKTVTSLFKKGSEGNEPMTIEEMVKEFQQRGREENQKEYQELCKLYEQSPSTDDWLILKALHGVLLKQI